MKNMAIVFDEQEVITNDFQRSEDIDEEDETPDSIHEISVDALKDRLKEAVESEDYEQATKLRDEIKRRENEKGN